MSSDVGRAPDGRRWISLGLLFGGHSCTVPGPLGAKELAPQWDPAAQLDEALW
ncbi:hypothetical protein JBE04_01670 [Streptomyces sp. PRKS01-29]|nr:hypothetical protein [Streptomyces sabulosicollis]MBI0293236.1 hypothetical protein [Streptomyces sabulosicollis]